jgi:hypothetical protein
MVKKINLEGLFVAILNPCSRSKQRKEKKRNSWIDVLSDGHKSSCSDMKIGLPRSTSSVHIHHWSKGFKMAVFVFLFLFFFFFVFYKQDLLVGAGLGF